jgi:hypothetical protein
MVLPLPFASADDASLVEGCLTETRMRAMFERRYGVFVQPRARARRAARERGRSRADDGPRVTQIRRDALVGWNGERQLRSFAVVARHLTLAQ